MKPLTPEQDYLLRATERRATQVAKFAELALRDGHFLPVVMAHAAWLLIKTLVLLCGESLQSTFLHWFIASLRRDAMLCDLCGQLKEADVDIACPACLKEMDEENQLVDQYELMEQMDPTKPNS